MHSTLASGSRYPGPVKLTAVHSHGLNAAEFCSDDALAYALQNYPAEFMDINPYGYDDGEPHRFETGTRGRLNGQELVAAIRNGELWVSLSNIEMAWPALWAAATDNFHDIAVGYPGLNAIKRTGQLIISSPRTSVPYHFDLAGVVLFHMRGRKRVFVYPGDEAHLSEEVMERVVTKQTTEDLPYSQDFERDAMVFDLMPGEAVIWPLYAPHRVENLDAFCVTLSVDFQTWGTRLRNGALYTHAVLRHRGVQPRSTDAMSKGALAMRWMMSLFLRRSGIVKNKIAAVERTFVTDAEQGTAALQQRVSYK